MEQYISKSALTAEIEGRRESNAKEKFFGRLVEDNYFLDFLNTLEVKEVDLEKEIKEEYLKRRQYDGKVNMLVILNEPQFNEIAKHFFELGLKASNPITAADRGTVDEIIISLKQVENDYRINHTKEIEWLRNKVKKGE